VQQALS